MRIEVTAKCEVVPGDDGEDELQTILANANANKVTIPDGVTEIGFAAFDSCNTLVSVTIPESVTRIDSFAFSMCSSLKKILVPSRVSIIENRAFENCTSLQKVAILSPDVSIVHTAFLNCGAINRVSIKDSAKIRFIGNTPLDPVVVRNLRELHVTAAHPAPGIPAWKHVFPSCDNRNFRWVSRNMRDRHALGFIDRAEAEALGPALNSFFRQELFPNNNFDNDWRLVSDRISSFYFEE